jgi:ribonuclease R
MKDHILKLLGQREYIPSNVPELLRGLNLKPSEQQRLQRALRALEQSGQIARIKGNRYILPKLADLIPGRIQMTRQGRGFLSPDDPNLTEISRSVSNVSP